MRTIQVLAIDDACTIGMAARREADRTKVSVTIAVCDSGGYTLWLQRMDGAPIVSAEIAQSKARACVLTGKATKSAEDMINNGRFAAVRMPVLPMEGGVPICVDGSVIGAVGVSGALPAEDAEVATAGARTLR